MAHALNMMTGFSTMPLQIASVMGFVFSLFGGLVLAWVLGRFLLQGNPVQGFPFLASIIAIFSGVQLFTIGIIGEYLARAHFRMMERPPFVIDERVNEPQI
jgi:undecaprenyl-phosphate 4-deoxy-4-formamido-L-arabinose transferase